MTEKISYEFQSQNVWHGILFHFRILVPVNAVEIVVRLFSGMLVQWWVRAETVVDKISQFLKTLFMNFLVNTVKQDLVSNATRGMCMYVCVCQYNVQIFLNTIAKQQIIQNNKNNKCMHQK